MLQNTRQRFAFFIFILGGPLVCKAQKPGLEGAAPSRWLTFKSTHAPGKVYQFKGSGQKTYTHEEYYMRAWIPVWNSKKFALVAGPHYRAEQLELKTDGNNPIEHLSDWDLRSYGLDLRSFVRLDSAAWLILTSNLSKSGNHSEMSFKDIPLNATFCAAFLRKKSPRKEIGAGILVNKSYKLTVLPAFIFNYNFNADMGLEMALPQKVALRRTISPSDILYLKGEAVTRTYYLRGVQNNEPDVCRRVDIDLGVSYNRRIGRYAGIELFGGYRQNLSNKLVEGAIPVKTSGLAATFELYVQPPRFKKN